MNDTPRIPSQFIEPNPYQDWHDPEPVQHDRPDDAPEPDGTAATPTPATAPPAPEAPADGPVPMAAGTYAVYDDQAGGYVLVIGTREGETHHKHIPAKVVKMAEMAMGGNSPLAAMFGAA